MQLYQQEFNGIIPQIKINNANSSGGRIVDIVNWNQLKNKHIPATAVNPQFSFCLDYLTLTYYLPSLTPIPTTAYDDLNFKASQKELERAGKTVSFKKQYSAISGYATQFLLWNSYSQFDYDDLWFDRDQLNWMGMEGRRDLIMPYLNNKENKVYGDIRHKLGISFAPRDLQGEDKIFISGGYSGSVSYLWQPEYREMSSSQRGKVSVGTVGREILSANSNRAIAYIGNAGTSRIYWAWGVSAESMVAGLTSFLDPGQSMTYEHGKLITPNANEDPLIKTSLCSLGLAAISESGVNNVVFQELNF
ncbi:MAG TPA: hypothetical protein V6D21_03095 [Candidatus Obscuribacterales bacterium]